MLSHCLVNLLDISFVPGHRFMRRRLTFVNVDLCYRLAYLGVYGVGVYIDGRF